jgi:hypothetical protein
LLALLLTLIGAYFLTKFKVRRLFGLNLLDRNTINVLIDPVKRFEPGSVYRRIRELIEIGSHAAILCQTQEQLDIFNKLSGQDLAPDKVEPNWYSITACDFNEIDYDQLKPEAKKSDEMSYEKSYKNILIQHFALKSKTLYSSENIKEDQQHMTHLLRLMQTPDICVFIPTTEPLSEILEFYKKSADQAAGQKEITDEDKEKISNLNQLVDLLIDADNYLVDLYISLNFDCKSESDTLKLSRIRQIEDESIRRLVLNELRFSRHWWPSYYAVYNYYTHLQKNLPPRTLKHGESLTIKEMIIKKIQELEHHDYNELWKSCTRQEKFVLYDAAQDKLINPNNQDTINILLEKGLMVYDGTFGVMNESFRNYILSTCDTDDAKKLYGDLSSKGRWKAYQAPIYLVILGCVIFFAFQQDLMSDLNAVLATLGGGIAILKKFTGLLPGLSFGKE